MPGWSWSFRGTVATRQQQIQELEAELTTLKAARTTALTTGSQTMIGSISVSGISSTNIQARITQIEKSIQRLKAGGRGIIVDMSARADGAGA